MKTLTEEQAQAITAFFEAFDLHQSGLWPVIEKVMKEEWGIDDPDAAITEAREAIA